MTTRATSKAIRLHKLENLLEQAPRSATELARLLDVGKRTIQRDLEALADLGHTLERRGRRYHLEPTTTTLNPVEAIAVHSATRLLVHHTRINERQHRSALTKLARQLQQPARRFLETSVEGIETLSSDGPRRHRPPRLPLLRLRHRRRPDGHEHASADGEERARHVQQSRRR